jgi:hypothetical protein
LISRLFLSSVLSVEVLRIVTVHEVLHLWHQILSLLSL